MDLSSQFALFDECAFVNNLLNFLDELLEEVAGDDGWFFEVLDFIRIFADEAVIEERKDIDWSKGSLFGEFGEFFGDRPNFVVFGEHPNFRVGFIGMKVFPHIEEVFRIVFGFGDEIEVELLGIWMFFYVV